MVEANIQIIEELKYFLEEVSTNPEFKHLVTQTDRDFVRDRKLTMERVVCFIINLPKRSLSIELQEFFSSLDKESHSCTKGAFSLQRTKLKPIFFEAWNKWLVTLFYHYYGSKVKRWRGFLLQAVDGTTAYLMKTKDVPQYFGTQDNQHSSIPMAQVMQIQDVLNDITIWGGIRPIKESEQTIISKQVTNFFTDSLTLFDRGFPSFSLMYLMLNEETPRQFVMRCSGGFNNIVKQFVSSGKASKIVEFRATDDAIRTLKDHGYRITSEATIKVRIVKVKLSTGEIEIILTSLYDEKLFTLDDLYYLYGLRWRIETAFGKQKNQQQMEQFSGHRVICIQQDYTASIFTANLQSLIEKQCSHHLQQINEHRKYRYKINRNVSWASLKNSVVKLFLQNKPNEILKQLQKEFQRNIEPIRPGRHPPRIKKNRRRNGKYQTVTNYRRAI